MNLEDYDARKFQRRKGLLVMRFLDSFDILRQARICNSRIAKRGSSHPAGFFKYSSPFSSLTGTSRREIFFVRLFQNFELAKHISFS